MSTDISTLDKDQLAAHAKTEFNVDLDLRKGIDKLRIEVSALQAPTAVEAAPVVNGTHILNRDTGRVFPYTEHLYNHLQNRVLCDKDGVQA